MSGYPYGGNPQYPPPQNPIYPQIYNPSNTQPPAAMSYPVPGQAGFPPQPPQVGFPPNYAYPGQPGQVPAGAGAGAPPYMGYPGANPSAPPYGYGFPNANQFPPPVGDPYGGNPQYPPPQNPIYPQIYNPSNTQPPAAMSYPVPGQAGFPPQPPQVGFPPNYAYPGQPGQVPAGAGAGAPPYMGYPGANPSAPPYGYGFPNANQFPPPVGAVEWVPTNPRDAAALSERAVVGGYEGYDNSPLWVIRARHEGDLIPGKLAVKHQAAYVPWCGKENSVTNIEVCCARPERVRWVESSNGIIPSGAVQGGNTANGETLYIGRARQQGSMTPGKVHPSHQSMYMSFAGKEVAHKNYEILISV